MKEIAVFEEPVRKNVLRLAVFSLDELEVPSVQRDVSSSLRKELELAIDKLGFLVPIVVVPGECKYKIIDGMHRFEAMKSLGVREILGIIVDESLYKYILDFNTEKPPSVKDKARQAYRLYTEFYKEDSGMIEEDLIEYVREPMLITFGFVVEEFERRFPVSFYESFVEKIDSFLRVPLAEGVEERRRRAKVLVELNDVVNKKFAEFGWENSLMKGEIVRKAVRNVYGSRVRVIEDDFYRAVELVKEECEKLTLSDFEDMEGGQ
jgi:ParB family chromosome partitioning protein